MHSQLMNILFVARTTPQYFRDSYETTFVLQTSPQFRNCQRHSSIDRRDYKSYARTECASDPLTYANPHIE